jgi:hypothetical protein
LLTGQLITASNVEVVSPQIQQQQTAKLYGETLHWKDTAQKKLRRGSQDATNFQSALSVDDEKLQGNSNEYHEVCIIAVENNLLYSTTSWCMMLREKLIITVSQSRSLPF